MATLGTSELRRRKKGGVQLLSKSTVSNDAVAEANIEDLDEKKKVEDNEYSAEFWYELKYTVVRCVLIVVIFFILNHVFNTYFLDPYFHRGSYYDQIRKQRKINEIRSRVCPQGAMDCNANLRNLDDLDL